MVRVFLVIGFLSLAVPAASQQPQPAPGPQTPPGQDILADLLDSKSGRREISPTHWRLIENAEFTGRNGFKFFADVIDLFLDTSRLVASGNVVFTNPEGRISAERVEFNLADGTGIFHQAFGILSLGDTVDITQFGNQDPDIYFYGNAIEKLGPRKYKLTRGGFSTCVQPTPRWEVTSASIVLNLNEYAVARNTILRVKGVPLLYLPVLYYPIRDDERATGFLLPTYGSSTLRGQAISNAFFWAIGRSQDATLVHDWFTRAGQGMGGEYRYVASSGSYGNVRAYRFNQNQREIVDNGQVGVLPENTSFDVNASVIHALGGGLRARGRVDYASDIISQQLYQQNVYRASNPSRTVEGGLSGTWGAFNAGALYQRTETFSNVSESTVYGSTPRLNGAVAPTRMFGLPVYGSLNSEYAHQPYLKVQDGETVSDTSVSRFDLAPTVRVPLSKLTFLTVNSNASYRMTYYDRSRDDRGRPVEESLTRRYLALRSDIIGPVFNRIWDTPDSLTIERMKHVIEPAFSIDYVSGIANYANLPSLSDSSDVVVGGSTRITYGINNRLFYRGRAVGAVSGTSREFLTIGLQQTYYTNPEASRWDYQYSAASGRTKFVDLSPIALTTRIAPNAAFSANTRFEYDVSGLGLQTISAGGSLNTTPAVANLSYSRVVYSPRDTSHYLSASNSLRLLQGRATGAYSLSWDLARSYVVSQRVAASYMAQCCGLQVEFQQFNYPESVGFPLPADRRFNFGFVLAGLGTFSNFFGAFGGQP